jgi:hypothetical protein
MIDGPLSFSGTIVNESFGGLCVACNEVPPWLPGSPISIHYWGQPMAAIVRRCECRGEGAFVGIEWA